MNTKIRYALLATVNLSALLVASSLVVRADTIHLKDGKKVEGIIQKVEKGEVTIRIGDQTSVVNILEVTSMIFDTPHVSSPAGGIPQDHFLGSSEAQSMAKHIKELSETAAEIKELTKQIGKDWGSRQPIESSDVKSWEAARERFRKPVARYQELLSDFYFHLVTRSDEYDSLMKEARKIYVGVKGAFNVGSPLVPGDMEKLPLRQVVPGNWYDTIFYQGYNLGYTQAYDWAMLHQTPR